MWKHSKDCNWSIHWLYNWFFARLYLTQDNMIAIDLSKHQGFDTDAKAIKQINFTANVDQAG